MTVIGELAVNAVVLTEGLERGSKDFKRGMGTMADSARELLPHIIGVTSASGLMVGAFELVANRAEKFKALDNAADRLGISTERLQEFNYAAKQTSNIE